MLNRDQIDQYHELGYVIPDFQLPMSVVGEMRNELDLLIEANPDKTADTFFVPHAPYGNHQGLSSPRSDKWMEFALNEEILAMVGQLIGDNLALWGTTVFGKPAHKGKATPWHQDGPHWPLFSDHVLTMWIPLVDAPVEMGPPKFASGTHTQKAFGPSGIHKTAQQFYDQYIIDNGVGNFIYINSNNRFHDILVFLYAI